MQKPQVWELSRLCLETSKKLYVHEFGFWTLFFSSEWFSPGPIVEDDFYGKNWHLRMPHEQRLTAQIVALTLCYDHFPPSPCFVHGVDATPSEPVGRRPTVCMLILRWGVCAIAQQSSGSVLLYPILHVYRKDGTRVSSQHRGFVVYKRVGSRQILTVTTIV
jgi:hypothetical protein